ncbi:uncharacterized protein LOC121413420 [Lytechinus variegatus]|uniref:uncharacterized protein LOC121413420 n=1 Tax=Lytechinus variegatus TaxID=7654 RepID=UPI001BB0F59A|nr:uncharacterized protein LOC121413420 [Lytechinus variegatus]XP_041462168.1 uncharacterized protein LOC121413420 [Lytechinus variegatus]
MAACIFFLLMLMVCHSYAQTWPSGTYGLPKPLTGCPSGWVDGRRKHDTEDTSPNNNWSDPLNLAGYQYSSSMEHEFCIKTSTSGSSGWPAGEYCIYKYGSCPSGFQEKFVYWDDEDSSNANSRSGTLPDGVYDNNTKYRFCCRNDGDTSQAISLPTGNNFYLFAIKATCQQVNGMDVTLEYFYWDNEDSSNADDESSGTNTPYPGVILGGIKLNFCYYQPASTQTWPSGTYGLPKPLTGCPAGWLDGRRKHDTEDTHPNNVWSDSLHLAGYQQSSSMEHEFCMKTSTSGSINWPAGDYCIYKKLACPSGFQEGYIYWDDEDSSNINTQSGTLPDGEYDNNTKYKFCCRDDGVVSQAITLPTTDNFYLFAVGDTCQQVAGKTVISEWFYWDNEDSSNADSQSGEHPYLGVTASGENIKLTFCYYN